MSETVTTITLTGKNRPYPCSCLVQSRKTSGRMGCFWARTHDLL